jgi:hypothetical protein
MRAGQIGPYNPGNRSNVGAVVTSLLEYDLADTDDSFDIRTG